MSVDKYGLFTSELGFQEVYSYYDKQFKDNGWNSIGEKSREYRKGKYWVRISEDSETPHHYSVTFYWSKFRM